MKTGSKPAPSWQHMRNLTFKRIPKALKAKIMIHSELNWADRSVRHDRLVRNEEVAGSNPARSTNSLTIKF